MSATSGGMSSDDATFCRELHKVLTSDRYKNKNSLFLQPFDLSQTPGYLDMCPKVMDLTTLASNLEAGKYSSKEAFFRDACLIFENAIKYHAGKQTKWIAKLGKDMLKIAQRERVKLMESSKGTAPSAASPPIPTVAGTSMFLPTKKNKKVLEEKKTGGGKLKLKIGGNKDKASSGATGNTKPKIKLKGPSLGKQPPPGVSTSAKDDGEIEEPKTKKPRLTLKLGLGKSKPEKTDDSSTKEAPIKTAPAKSSSSSSSKTSTPKTSTPKTSTPKTSTPKTSTPKTSTPKSTAPKPSTPKTEDPSKAATASGGTTGTPASAGSSSATKGKISLKLSAAGGGGSRGKELPKGVSVGTTKSEPKKTTKKSTTKKASADKKATSDKKAVSEKKTPSDKKAAADKKTTADQKATPDKKGSPDKKSMADKKTTADKKTATDKKSTADKKSTSDKSSTKSKAGATASSSKAKASKAKLSLTPTSSSSNNNNTKTENRSMMLMTPVRNTQCSKVLSGLKRRQAKTVGWFLQPVSDKGIIQDYKAKIKNPVDLSMMQTKLEKNEYPTIGAFVLDLRRIFANCLKYNTSIKDSLRPVAIEALQCAEQLMTVFLAKPEQPTVVYPPLLFCWKHCLGVLDTLYNLTNPEDGQPTALYFLHPVSFYCGGQFPPDYLEKVKKPMDFGTVTANLVEGQYTSASEFEADCKLVLENCRAYYGGKDDAKIFIDQANRLQSVLKQQLDTLNRYLKSPSGETAKRQSQFAITTVHVAKPPIPLLLGVLDELKSLKYTDKATKITEPAMGPFEKPVSLAAFPNYTQHVQSPMDLQTVERKVKSAGYTTPEDFEYDMILIFQNCITYNLARKTDHLVAMGRFGMKHFRKIFAAKMKPFDDPSSTSQKESPVERKSAVPLELSQPAPSKKLKLDSGVSRGKKAPRINVNTSQATSAAASSSTSISQAKASQAPRPKPTTTPKTTVPKAKPDQPVPLHIAIAQVKEQFPSRRAAKALQPWEGTCARFYKEMMRHTWISAARPKFIFHVPVPVLFPELREAYAAKIKTPMDFTTIECTLLDGTRYTCPEDFVNDLALVFTNAIKFNKDGRDVGDPLSCAYYDASIHLLRYCRWLSLDFFDVEESDHVDEPDQPGLPPTSWKLTKGNRKVARKEMEEIVLREPIEKSLEGDRYTWMEAECEKLLKALRHQSDYKKMQFFIQPNYPPDYSGFISKPMDWERVQKTLKKRHYDKFGDIIDDLRLIFSNALKYNARHAGTDTVSGQAYDSAKYMSGKLETAINKMMLTVSDRIERERIDHNNAEREIEAAERAEEARIRAQWKSENDGKEGAEPMPQRIETTKSRMRAAKRINLRRENADFEVPFFDDEDDGNRERSYVEVIRQQKAMFERQRQELAKMQQTATSLGAGVFLRMTQHNLAHKWVTTEKEKLGIATPASQAKSKTSDATTKSDGKDSSAIQSASSVLAKLDTEGRSPFQLKMAKPKPKKRKAAALAFDDEDDEE